MPLPVLNIEMLLTEFDNSFYTIPLLFILNVLFLIVALRTNSREASHRTLVTYGSLFLLATLFSFFITIITKVLIKDPQTINIIGDYAILFFVQAEFVIFYIFFYVQFPGKKVKKIIATTGKITAAGTLLLGLFTIFFSFPLSIRRLSGYISVTESILILIPAFYYFYILFLEPPVKNLLREPSFWVTTGIAFLHSLNISNFLIDNYLSILFNNIWPGVYSINYTAYCFLFILFIISQVCQKNYHKQSLHLI